MGNLFIIRKKKKPISKYADTNANTKEKEKNDTQVTIIPINDLINKDKIDIPTILREIKEIQDKNEEISRPTVIRQLTEKSTLIQNKIILPPITSNTKEKSDLNINVPSTTTNNQRKSTPTILSAKKDSSIENKQRISLPASKKQEKEKQEQNVNVPNPINLVRKSTLTISKKTQVTSNVNKEEQHPPSFYRQINEKSNLNTNAFSSTTSNFERKSTSAISKEKKYSSIVNKDKLQAPVLQRFSRKFQEKQENNFSQTAVNFQKKSAPALISKKNNSNTINQDKKDSPNIIRHMTKEKQDKNTNDLGQRTFNFERYSLPYFQRQTYNSNTYQQNQYLPRLSTPVSQTSQKQDYYVNPFRCNTANYERNSVPSIHRQTTDSSTFNHTTTNFERSSTPAVLRYTQETSDQNKNAYRSRTVNYNRQLTPTYSRKTRDSSPVEEVRIKTPTLQRRQMTKEKQDQNINDLRQKTFNYQRYSQPSSQRQTFYSNTYQQNEYLPRLSTPVSQTSQKQDYYVNPFRCNTVNYERNSIPIIHRQTTDSSTFNHTTTNFERSSTPAVLRYTQETSDQNKNAYRSKTVNYDRQQTPKISRKTRDSSPVEEVRIKTPTLQRQQTNNKKENNVNQFSSTAVNFERKSKPTTPTLRHKTNKENEDNNDCRTYPLGRNSSSTFQDYQNTNDNSFTSSKENKKEEDELTVFGHWKGNQGEELIYFFAQQQSGMFYVPKELIQTKKLYQTHIKKKNELMAIGEMSLLTKNREDQNIRISINGVGKHRSAFYKCDTNTQLLHFGVIMENQFTIKEEGGNKYEYKYCLAHSFVNQLQKVLVSLEFKNELNFSEELGVVLKSSSGQYLTTDEEKSDPKATAKVMELFIDSVVDMQFKIKGGFNCFRFQAYLNYLLSRHRNTKADIEEVFTEFQKNLPLEIRKLAPRFKNQ